MTRKAWGRILIDEGRVQACSPMFHEWAGRSSDALLRHFQRARFERR